MRRRAAPASVLAAITWACACACAGALALAGCRRTTPVVAKGDDAGAEAAGLEETAVSTAPARRCGECHGALEEQWRGSAHARAETSPAYAAMKADPRGARDETCDACHAPIAKYVAADSPLRGEGVTCDACHAMRDARADRAGAGYVLALADNTKYGPLCDAKNHYFHKVGCSPMHGEARQCGSCHLWWKTAKGGASIPVFTEYEEWQASNFGTIGVVCQDCHMPGSAGELAVGAGRRPAVSHHGFAASAEQRARALVWKIAVSGDARRVRATVTLRSDGVGHAVPTGLPGRRLVLRARVVDADGGAGAVDERTYARVLVDAAGLEVPFTEAVRVASDNRLQAGEARTETFELDAPSGGTLAIDLARIELGPAIASALGVATHPDEVVLSARVPFGPPRGGTRALLPRTIDSTPK